MRYEKKMFVEIYTNKQGNFLLEVMVALAIVAFLALLSIPMINRAKPSLELKTAGRELLSDIRYCQQLAVSEQIRHEISFDLNENNYKIVRLSDNKEIKKISFMSEIEIATSTLFENSAIFNSFGSVSQPGKITLQNKSGDLELEIKPSGSAAINR